MKTYYAIVVLIGCLLVPACGSGFRQPATMLQHSATNQGIELSWVGGPITSLTVETDIREDWRVSCGAGARCIYSPVVFRITPQAQVTEISAENYVIYPDTYYWTVRVDFGDGSSFEESSSFVVEQEIVASRYDPLDPLESLVQGDE